MKAFKGFDKDLKCRDFQYEVGKGYTADKASLCNTGFHACVEPLDVFGYYPPSDSRFAEVELDGVKDEKDGDSKRVGTRIKIVSEITLKGMIEAGVKFILERVDWKNAPATNTGDRSAATNTGDRSAATNTGYQSAATNTGYRSEATNTGNQSAATNTGYQSAATNTGDRSAAIVEGIEAVAVSLGVEGKAKGFEGCWIVLAEWKEVKNEWHRIAVKSVPVDGKKIKADTFYVLKNGKFTEAK